MKILLLGANGYLGRHAARALRALPGAELYTAGRRPPHDLTLDLAAGQMPALMADLAALAPDAVVNCAGAVSGSALNLAEANARGPALLSDAMLAAAPQARLVHLGSAAEYGATEMGVALTERSPVAPVGVYGATKLAGSLAVAGSRLEEAVVLRVFNPVGPGAPAQSLPGRLAGELRRVGPQGRIRVGDLSAYRDFVDVRDLAEAVALAVTAPRPLPRVLNLGSGSARPVRELVRALTGAAGFRGELVEEAAAGSERSAVVPWQRADVGAAAEHLGWRPVTPLERSLADLWESTAAEGARDGAERPAVAR
ncbi:NAD-dependent epimerase/dehydratase family protein [Kitasatospora viridis]|uniref:Nucleoside-diphosphate-sugar epimerase n=1 Tax=Kitasatospora viridis TaxID=281105 RepID=A0A561TTI7_9ACTN|nr:NAD(P)-dependent oxidoreductase [Kitasatospora viridis]TWF90441.1 nucleoside-diphosphate-sugar epimerase [Kitasatospora viridis]